MMRRVAIVMLVAGCGPSVEDGIFEAGYTSGRAPGDGSDGGADTSGSSDRGDDAATADPDDGPSPDGSSGGEESTTGGAATGCPDAVGPGVYTCPTAFEFWTEGSVAQCRVQQLTLPNTTTVFDYCGFLDDGLLGFGWDLGTEDPGFACPPGTRYAPNATIGYCLWEDIVLPAAGASAACTALLSERWLGFQWPCP